MLSDQGPFTLSINISANDLWLAKKACQADGGFPTVEIWIQHLIHETMDARLPELSGLPSRCLYTTPEDKKPHINHIVKINETKEAEEDNNVCDVFLTFSREIFSDIYALIQKGANVALWPEEDQRLFKEQLFALVSKNIDKAKLRDFTL